MSSTDSSDFAFVNVLLDHIAGLNYFVGLAKSGAFGLDSTTFSSCAVSADGKVAYFGRTASYDPAMRNLVVASLDTSGNVIGIPQCYPSSAWPLAPINGYPAVTSGYKRRRHETEFKAR